MKRIKVNGHIIEVIDSPEKLPIKRFQKFNKFFMIDLEMRRSLQLKLVMISLDIIA